MVSKMCFLQDKLIYYDETWVHGEKASSPPGTFLPRDGNPGTIFHGEVRGDVKELSTHLSPSFDTILSPQFCEGFSPKIENAEMNELFCGERFCDLIRWICIGFAVLVGVLLIVGIIWNLSESPEPPK